MKLASQVSERTLALEELRERVTYPNDAERLQLTSLQQQLAAMAQQQEEALGQPGVAMLRATALGEEAYMKAMGAVWAARNLPPAFPGAGVPADQLPGGSNYRRPAAGGVAAASRQILGSSRLAAGQPVGAAAGLPVRAAAGLPVGAAAGLPVGAAAGRQAALAGGGAGGGAGSAPALGPLPAGSDMLAAPSSSESLGGVPGRRKLPPLSSSDTSRQSPPPPLAAGATHELPEEELPEEALYGCSDAHTFGR